MHIKVSKGGGTCINLPKAFCEELNIKPGDELECNLKDGKIVLSTVKPVYQIVEQTDKEIVVKSNKGNYCRHIPKTEFFEFLDEDRLARLWWRGTF